MNECFWINIAMNTQSQFILPSLRIFSPSRAKDTKFLLLTSSPWNISIFRTLSNKFIFQLSSSYTSGFFWWFIWEEKIKFECLRWRMWRVRNLIIYASYYPQYFAFNWENLFSHYLVNTRCRKEIFKNFRESKFTLQRRL